jgi:hypothetical protein
MDKYLLLGTQVVILFMGRLGVFWEGFQGSIKEGILTCEIPFSNFD